MKKIIVLTAVIGLLAVSMTSADFPRRGRSCSSPCYSPCYEPTYVAPIVASHVTTIIQEPIPTFIFQNLSGYPNLPASVTQPQQQPYSPPAVTSSGLNDRDIDRIANLVVQRLQGAAVSQQINLIPPALEPTASEQPMVMSQAVANSLGNSCAACHMQNTAAKGGLTIFNANRQFQPEKNGQPYDQPARLWQRAEEGSMPPTAGTDVSKRLNPEAVQFLKQWAGQ